MIIIYIIIHDFFFVQVYATERETKERYTAKTRIDIHLERSKKPVVVPVSPGKRQGNLSNGKLDLANKHLLTLAAILCTLFLAHAHL